MRRSLLLVVLCIPALFLFLGSSAITDSDEAYYAEAAREMVESGDWITPHFNYQLRFEKPILFYWLIAAAYLVAGVSEEAARFWSAMSGVGLTLVAYACGRRWIDEETGFLAGSIAATSFATAAMGRMALPDLPLAFFISVAVWTAFEALRPETAGHARRWLVLSAAACALAMLTKGPVGVGLPVLIVVAAVALEFFFLGRRRTFSIRASDLFIATVVFVAIAVPWYAAVTSVHGVGYLYRFFVAENFDRFATARYNDPRPLWFYLPILIGGLLPWSLFGVLWLRKPAAPWTPATAAPPHVLRLVLWALVPLAVFSVSVGKQPRYILPCLVPLALLLARAIVARIRQNAGRRDIVLTTIGVLTSAMLFGVAFLLLRVVPLVAAAGGSRSTAWAALVGAVGTAVLIASFRRDARLLLHTTAAAAAATLLAIHGAVLSSGRTDAVTVAADAVTAIRAADADVCACGAFLRNLPFYVRAPVVAAGTQQEIDAVLTSARPAVAVIDARKLDDFESRTGQRVRRLLETRHLNTALLRLDDFLHPDPDRVLQRIVVIRTR